MIVVWQDSIQGNIPMSTSELAIAFVWFWLDQIRDDQEFLC